MNKTEDIVDLIARLQNEGTCFALATVIRTKDATSAKAGAKAVILADGTISGWIGGGCVQGAARRVAQAVIADNQPQLVRVKPRDEVVAQTDIDGVELHKSSCPSGGTVELFVEPMLSRPRLVVCGASPIARAVSDLGRRMGYSVANAALEEDHGMFPDSDLRIIGFDVATIPDIDVSFIVICTQGKRDREALAAALATGADYVAFVGSGKKSATLKEQLSAQGMAPSHLARLRSPAGLDIGAVGPEEIALSVLAEIVQFRRAARARQSAPEAARK